MILQTSQDLDNTKALLQESEIDIQDRDETLLQLEALLQKTTDRFARKMEEERHRVETNKDVNIQAKPSVSDFQQQADFIKNVVRDGPISLARPAITRDAYATSNRFLDFDDDGSIDM